MQTGNDMEKKPLYWPVIDCPHEIETGRITLYFDENKPGNNALDQLGARMDRAFGLQSIAPAMMSDAELRAHFEKPATPESSTDTAGSNGAALYARLKSLMPDDYPDEWSDLLEKYRHLFNEAAIADTSGAKPEISNSLITKVWEKYDPTAFNQQSIAIAFVRNVLSAAKFENTCTATPSVADAAGASEDARDAARYREVRTNAYLWGIDNPTPEQLDAQVDASLKESGND